MIPLETTGDCLVGMRPELLSDEQDFFIFDRQQQFILRFDQSGKFINRIGRLGGGPEEYQGEINDFDIDPTAHSVEILASTGQILRYNYDGTFISSQHIDGFPTSFIKSSANYWLNLGVSKLNADGYLLKVSEEGSVIEKYFPLETEWFGLAERNFTRSGNIISFKEIFNHTVYRITNDGPVKTTMIDFGKYALPDNTYGRNQFAVVDELETKGWAYIYKYLENEQFVYVDFKVQQNHKAIGAYYWLINKKTGNSVIQKLSIDDPLFKMMEEAKILTTGNELVFLANAQMLKECTDPFFSNANNINYLLSVDANPVIVRLKINHF
jgi:hypothetical protein